MLLIAALSQVEATMAAMRRRAAVSAWADGGHRFGRAAHGAGREVVAVCRPAERGGTGWNALVVKAIDGIRRSPV